ncbi:MAG: hypothetical protein KBT87_14470 [Gammaproteobacteria bacterium]|nr:hypothetical protein [Gammaproteobacteria bacterium]
MNSLEYTDISFSVRLSGLPKEMALHVCNRFGMLPHSLRPFFKDKNLKVISFDLTRGTNIALIGEAIGMCNAPGVVADVFISISSGVQTQILGIPDFVVCAIKELAVQINLSYTVFSDDDWADE